MLFMVIESFRDNDMIPVYQHMKKAGRLLPEGLQYLDSWVEPNFARCFQLMRCNDFGLLQAWVLNWRETGVLFEIVPVVPSKDTREIIDSYLTSVKTGSST